MYSVNDELPDGFFDGHHTGIRTKKNRISSSGSPGSASKKQYVIEEKDDDDDDEDMTNSRHRLRLRIVAIALVFTIAAFIAFGVALYFSTMDDSSADLEPVIDDEKPPSPMTK